MARQLVTVARFDIPATAHIARNALEEAGIKSVLQDEQLVAMDYLLSLAVGGIKIQVWEEDAERAVALLEDLTPGDGEPPGEAGAVRESDNEGTVPRTVSNDRERYALRALLAALCSVLVAPVALYTAYLLVMTLFSEGQLTLTRRWGVFIAVLITPVFMLVSPFWIGAAFSLITTGQLPE